LITEIPKESFHKIKPLIGEFSHYLVLTMLTNGKTPAKVWVNHLEKPTAAFVWDRLNTLFFVLGDSSDHEFNQALNNLIVNLILPEAIQLEYRKFFLQFTPQQGWEDQIDLILKTINYEQRSIYSYRLDPQHTALTQNLIPTVPTDYHIERITAEVLSNPYLTNQDRIVADIKACWHSTDQYLEKNGIGYCVRKGNAIASWCSTDYVIDNECELYVETFEGYQRVGLGTQVSLACVQECFARGLIVRWHCFDYARGSAKIAEKIHFMKTEDCPVFIVNLRK